MTFLKDQLVIALGDMAERPLARFMASLGAAISTDVEQVGQASFLIENLGLPRLEQLGLSRATLKKENPRLIHVSVTAFGSFGDRAQWQGGELVSSAMGGTLILTGNPDRRPVKEALNACEFHAEMVAASGAMAAYYSRKLNGTGQHVDVSVQEVAFNRNVNGTLAWRFDKRKLGRAGGALNYGKATVKCIWKLSDGWCFHSLMTGRFGAPANQALSDWMDETGMENPMKGTDWLAYNRSTLDPDIRASWEAAIADFFAGRTKEDILTEGRRRGINACVVAEPGDVLADPHLDARDFWARDGDGDRMPGRFVRIVEGQEAAPVEQRRGDRKGPLSGLRVLDFSWALVGSITTKTLADLGAEVIKVESRGRPCMSRLDVQVSVSEAGNFNDKPWFAHLNTSKKSLALDLKKPESREVLTPLIEWADMVVENFSPGTMAKLGLSFEDLEKIHPGIVMVSGSVYGQTGPLAQEWGVDGTGGALSSRTYLTGWPDRDPVIPGAVPYGDVIVPFVMAAAGIAAIDYRQKTGISVHIDASMYEICVQQMRDAIKLSQSNLAPHRRGNSDPGMYFQDVFPASGADRWVALSLKSEEDERRLIEITGGQDIDDWTRSQDAVSIMEKLQEAGISCGVVQDIEDICEHDRCLMQRGALVNIEHKHLGQFGHMRTPVSFSAEEIQPFRAPDIGEHSLEVASDLAGLSEERIEQLAALEVFK
ncbi:CoA transferase [Emcibacter sp.]|uniref:CaiB/BaiF CoA-transferase family protein n=1 Tax=Emcibacter sp. TaxID=1979954 RepID=UPI003A8F37C9